MERLDCKELSKELLEEVISQTKVFVEKGNRAPSLAVVLVGENPASLSYVKSKEKAARKCGFMHFQYSLGEDAKEDELLSLIDRLNKDDEVDGILVQLPLPKHIDERKIVNAISKSKDVDGFSNENMGALLKGEEAIIPCTPLGILKIIDHFSIETASKRVLVIGRSNIVGKPIAALLMQKGRDATITVANTKTENIDALIKDSDIIILAAGKPNLLGEKYVKDGAVIIDVGINRVKDPFSEKGYVVRGDADFESFESRDVRITPVPGGVGLMTVSSLMQNTLKAALMRREI